MKRPKLPSLFRGARRRTKRFGKDTSGVSSIEFAFIIGPFLAITLGTMEVALVHIMRSSVSNAVEGASRPIYTGAAGCATVDTVKTAICSRITLKSEADCKANLRVVLQDLGTFNAQRSNVDTSDFDAINDEVDPGGPDSVMLLRTFFRWNVMFPMLSETLGGDNGNLVLSASTAFKNEPFGANTGCQNP
jgi:Flp pilus assembly protein TadG